jgi:hypothetical protein
MIKTLLAGAALGYFGRKLYEEGKLDPLIAKAKSKLDEKISDLSGRSANPPSPAATG